MTGASEKSTTYTYVCKDHLSITLCRSMVWIGMKVLQADSIILGTKKLSGIFPIKQKFDTMASFLDNSNYSIWSFW